MTNDVVLYFLALVIITFLIVFAIMFIGYRRTRSVKDTASPGETDPGIDVQRGPIEQRLGGKNYTEESLRKRVEPRGDDIGGNFSGTSDRSDTSRER